MKSFFGLFSFRKIHRARKRRHEKSLTPQESVFLRESNRHTEQVFFWRVLTISTLGLFFFSVMHRFAISAPIYYFEEFEEVQNTPMDDLVFMEDGFLKKQELWTEVGDRSDVSGVIDYVVEANDTISGIAQRFGVTQRTILQNNDFLDPKRLKPGQVLKIPAADGVVHQVSSGETISSIAKKYKVEEERLLSQNELTEESVLQEGEEIIVPGAKRSPPKPKVVVQNPSAASYAYGRETAGQLLFPTQGRYTQYFHYGHYAVDIASGRGTPIYAADSGTVIRADYGWNGGYGNVVVIDHGNGMKTLYAHNTELLVSVGQSVSRGQPISTMGNTGRVYGRTGIHLHFEVMVNGVKKNPVVYF